MRRTQHPSNNRVLGAPDGWDQADAECGALAITDDEVNGMRCVKSYWRPSDAELMRLARGAFVTLWVVGDTHPPVAIEVEA